MDDYFAAMNPVFSGIGIGIGIGNGIGTGIGNGDA